MLAQSVALNNFPFTILAQKKQMDEAQKFKNRPKYQKKKVFTFERGGKV